MVKVSEAEERGQRTEDREQIDRKNTIDIYIYIYI